MGSFYENFPYLFKENILNMKEGKAQNEEDISKAIIIFIAYLVFFYVLDLVDAWSKLKVLFFTK